MFIVSVNVLIPLIVFISLFLKNPESSISTLSTFCLLSVVLNLCCPPPFVSISIVPIPASALVCDSDMDI